MHLRQMETEDLGILLEMAHVEGWSSEMLEFELYTQLNPDGCFTCIADNNVVGGVMTFAYPNSGWIGNTGLKVLGKLCFAELYVIFRIYLHNSYVRPQWQ